MNLIGFALTTAGLLAYSEVFGADKYKEVEETDAESIEDDL